MKFSEAENVDGRDKARIQLMLARNYQRASQYDIARAEFTTVLNIHKDQPEAMEARFGIGETYMAQKIYDQAGDCVMPREGIFVKVLRGGRVAPGDRLTVVGSAPEAEDLS